MMPILKGYATEQATKNYADKIWQENPKVSPNSWRIFEGCTVGKIGFGSHRLNGTAEQVLALRSALLSGVNLIETSRTFTDGASEKMIGDVLKSMSDPGDIQREEVMIISQAGYLSGENLLSHQLNKPKDVVEITPHLWHCMHPDFLAEELFNSLSHLGLETIDGYMLQNPEHFIEVSLRDSLTAGTEPDIKEIQEAFYQRLEQAFAFLEQCVIEGKIRFYGISSNAMHHTKDVPNFVDLSMVSLCAQKAAQTAHGRKKRPAFRVLELPLNMLELGALKNVNTTAHLIDDTEEVSTLELASRMHLNVLAKRPLNTLNEEGLPLLLINRSAEEEHNGDLSTKIEETKNLLIREEEVLSALIGGWPSVSGNRIFSFTVQGDELIQHVQNGFIYKQLEAQFFTPTLALMSQAFETFKAQKEEDETQIDAIAHNYKVLFTQLQKLLKEQCLRRDEESLKPLEMEIRSRCPEHWKDAPLQQISLNAVASIPGVSCVLNSLNEKKYIEDIQAIQERGDFADIAPLIGSQTSDHKIA